MPAPLWYEAWHGRRNLEQGLIIPKFQYPLLDQIPLPGVEIEKDLDYEEGDVIILTQSCDLSGKQVENVQVCPVSTLNEVLKSVSDTSKARSAAYKDLAQGRHSNKYLSNIFSDANYLKITQDRPNAQFDESIARFRKERLVVDFVETRVVPVSYLRNYIKRERTYLRLNSPYREALAQKFGLFFMRVGNPVDYAEFKDSEYTPSSS